MKNLLSMLLDPMKNIREDFEAQKIEQKRIEAKRKLLTGKKKGVKLERD